MTMLDVRPYVAKETKEALLGLEMGSPSRTTSILTQTLLLLITI